jgi:hypothetical protein
MRANAAVRRRRIKQKVIDGYGGACVCCGEHRFEFLTLDHVNGDGAEHRRELSNGKSRRGKGGAAVYDWAIKNNYPDRCQLLCWNCNAAKGYYGYCPHEKEQK